MNIKRLILFFTSIFFLSGANFETAAGERTALRIGHDYGPAADVMEFVDAWAYLQKHESTKSVTAALDLPSSKPFGLTSSQFATHKMAWRRSMLAANNNMPSATLTSVGEAPIGTATPGSKAWEAAEAGSQPSDNSVSGLYFVIGSLSRVADINGFSKRRWQLGSQVVVTQLEGQDLYREVVGPFPRSQQATVRGRLTQAGIRDAWLAFLEPALWQLVPPAMVEETLATIERQIAAIY
jgi:hypothetical protein